MSAIRNRGRHYKPGDNFVICDECGFKFYASETRMRWDGMIVCSKDWEPRHPQDYVKGRADQQKVTNARPDDDRFEQSPVTVDDL
jgi:hypothetical protein